MGLYLQQEEVEQRRIDGSIFLDATVYMKVACNSKSLTQNDYIDTMLRYQQELLSYKN